MACGQGGGKASKKNICSKELLSLFCKELIPISKKTIELSVVKWVKDTISKRKKDTISRETYEKMLFFVVTKKMEAEMRMSSCLHLAIRLV